jgi:hypothetical protein
VSRGIIADGVGWQLVVYLVLAPILFLALAVLFVLTFARKTVRERRAISWPDVAVQTAIATTAIAYGLFAIPALAVILVLALVAGFWVAVVQLVTETRDRVKTFLDAGAVQPARTIPDVIVIPPSSVSR